MNIDTFIIDLLDNNFISAHDSEIPNRDIRIIHSLAKSLTSSAFITERQGQLLVKIIKENINTFNQAESNLDNVLELNQWSKPFRKQDTTKKLYIKDSKIYIEFAFSTVLRRKLTELALKIVSLTQEASGKLYHADLCESNIDILITNLSKLGFEVDPNLQKYYSVIKEWNVEDQQNKFLINTIDNPRYKQLIAEDLGIDTPLNQNIINDRSTRYQYYVKKLENPTTLTEIIANRVSTKLWINSSEYTLTDIVKSLIELKRLPLMIVFSMTSAKKLADELKLVHKALQNNNINDHVGVYFRVDNEGIKSEFNQLISDYNYKAVLDQTTKIVGVQNSKIPKFFLKSAWQPMSVISLGDSLKTNKTAVYARCSDCIITYTETKPLITQWEQN